MAKIKGDNKISNSSSPIFDSIKWGVVSLLLIGAIVANQVYYTQPLSLRMIAGLAVVGIVFAIAISTLAGKRFLLFANGAREELRKVVWPTRQETVQTTLIVIVMVVVSSLMLWGIDTFLLWIIGYLTGERG